MTQTLSDLSVTEAASLALKTIAYGEYLENKNPDRKWGTPYTGTFEEFVKSYVLEEYDDEEDATLENFDSDSVWQHYKYESTGAELDGYTAKVVASFGGEGEGDQYWMVVSITDGKITRYFRKDGWYASYDGGYLDGDTNEVYAKEKTIVVYE